MVHLVDGLVSVHRVEGVDAVSWVGRIGAFDCFRRLRPVGVGGWFLRVGWLTPVFGVSMVGDVMESDEGADGGGHRRLRPGMPGGRVECRPRVSDTGRAWSK